MTLGLSSTKSGQKTFQLLLARQLLESNGDLSELSLYLRVIPVLGHVDGQTVQFSSYNGEWVFLVSPNNSTKAGLAHPGMKEGIVFMIC